MADTNNARNKEVNVEDLLRLKRLERPNDAFWNKFDGELHQRMLQTLVKKDPWYVQLLRGVSGRIAQTTAVGAAAAFLAMMVVRPAFVETSLSDTGNSYAQQQVETISSTPVEVMMSEFDTGLAPDYQIEDISGVVSTSEFGYSQVYALDTIEVATYDSNAYVMDTASFASTSLATGLVY
jgi:hypothetical protein